MGKRIFTPTPPKMHQNASFSYLKYKNFSAGRGTPPPRTPPPSAPSAPRFSRLRCSMGPPRKNPGYGPESAATCRKDSRANAKVEEDHIYARQGEHRRGAVSKILRIQTDHRPPSESPSRGQLVGWCMGDPCMPQPVQHPSRIEMVTVADMTAIR
jgi:hypothetical protein